MTLDWPVDGVFNSWADLATRALDRLSLGFCPLHFSRSQLGLAAAPSLSHDPITPPTLQPFYPPILALFPIGNHPCQ